MSPTGKKRNFGDSINEVETGVFVLIKKTEDEIYSVLNKIKHHLHGSYTIVSECSCAPRKIKSRAEKNNSLMLNYSHGYSYIFNTIK